MNSPVTRTILLDKVKSAQKAANQWEADVDDYVNEYAAMLNEAYSLESVGGPFAHMLPSRVLKECDETAYRCGLIDYVDSLDTSEHPECVELTEALQAAEDALEEFDAKEGE